MRSQTTQRAGRVTDRTYNIKVMREPDALARLIRCPFMLLIPSGLFG